MVQPAAVKYDHAVLDCYRELAGLDALSPSETAQCQLQLRSGGERRGHWSPRPWES